MSFTIEKKAPIKLMGLSIITRNIEGENNIDIPKFWTFLHENGTFKRMWDLSIENNPDKVCYGVCLSGGEAPDEFEYLVGVPYGNNNEEYEILDVPETTYAIFECKGPMPWALQKMWADIFTDWLPNKDYDIDIQKPQIELYPQGDPNAEDYLTQIWIPVIEK